MTSKDTEYATVEIKHGKLRGRKVTIKTSSFFSFQGVPYAKPPVGALRFKPPQPIEQWKGIRDALKEGPMSAQKDFLLNTDFLGDEDCLYLNVYTTELPGSERKVRKPVMVFIHGGGFGCGSGNTNLYGPDYLVSEVVLVTINYRLGALGFLSLVEASVPGNNGLKDQTAALRWVKENIIHFGGDPDNVTIFGESAGGASVQFHVLSPMSKGLFHKAIAQSGSVFCPWAMCSPEQAQERAFRMGKFLGFSKSNQKELLEFLYTVTAQEIVEASEKAREEEKKLFHVTYFLPVCETHKNQTDLFLPGSPEDILNSGTYNHVPYMTGITSHEGIWLTQLFRENPLYNQVFKDEFEFILPHSLYLRKNSKDIAKQIKKHYFGTKESSEECIMDQIDFHTHTWFFLAIDKTIKLLKRKAQKPIFYYLFDFVGEYNFYKKYLNADSLPGASHIDDLGYLFRMDLMDIDVPKDSSTYKMVQKMVKLWTNFAKTGNPTAILDNDINVEWPPITSSKNSYFKISTDLSVHEDLMKDDADMWSKFLS